MARFYNESATQETETPTESAIPCSKKLEDNEMFIDEDDDGDRLVEIAAERKNSAHAISRQ